MLRLAVVLAAAALVSTACGAGGAAPPATTRGPAEQLLSQADVDSQPEGSPAHALLVWWQAAQFANLTAYLDGYERSLRETLEASPETGDALVYFAATIRNARPTIVDVQEEGDRATVYTRVVYRQPVGSRRFVVYTVPRAFAMIRQAGDWRLLDDLFVQAALTEQLKRNGT
jgi:hypothetical protein